MRIVVVGTGTGVGKTHVSVALLEALRRRGAPCAGLKPVETGLTPSGSSDRELLASAGTFHVKHWPYGFAEPLSPHLAARLHEQEIELEVVSAWVDAVSPAVAVVETAGGLLSPLSESTTNLDLVTRLAPDELLVVGPNRLGILHEMSACIATLRASAPRLPGPILVLSSPDPHDGSSASNHVELLSLRMSRAVVSFPRDEPLGRGSQEAAETVLKCFT